MLSPDQQFVFHGSHERFENAVPKQQLRVRRNAEGVEKVIFDQISFHATRYRWIALAYTYVMHPVLNKKGEFYNMGVDLYEHKPELMIYGVDSLEHTLDKLYGAGGYLHKFNASDFTWMEGLGNLEVASFKEVVPVDIERIEDPVQEMRNAGVTFKFIDVSKTDL